VGRDPLCRAIVRTTKKPSATEVARGKKVRLRHGASAACDRKIAPLPTSSDEPSLVVQVPADRDFDVARMSTPDTLIPSLVFKGKEMHHQK
jgi:hypothetical protein